MGYEQSDYDSSDSDIDSYEEIEKMYDHLERRKTKIKTIKKEISKLSKNQSHITFNVFNITEEALFNEKMKSDYSYLDFEVKEMDTTEKCIVVQLEKNLAEDFLNMEGDRIGNHNLSIYLDDQQETGKKPRKDKTKVKDRTQVQLTTKHKITKPEKSSKRKRLISN